MTDLSKYGFVESDILTSPIKQENQDLSKYGFIEDNSIQPKVESHPELVQAPERSKLEQKASPIIAGVAGLSNAGANIGETLGRVGTWILDKVGAIDPETKTQIDEYLKKGSDVFRSSANERGDIFERSLAANPMIGAISQATPEALAIAKTPSPGFKAGEGSSLGAKLGTIAANQIGTAGINAPIAAGMSSDENQDINAGITAAAGPIVSTLGQGVKWLGSSSVLKDKLKSLISPILNKGNLDDAAGQSIATYANTVKKFENENWNELKNVPGTIPTKPISSQLNSIRKGNLDDKQLNILNNLSEDVSNMTTTEDAIRLKQAIAANRKNFIQGKSSSGTYNQYMDLKESVDNALSKHIENAGLGKAWKSANNFHSKIIAPMEDSGAFEIAKAIDDKLNNPELYNSTEYAKQIGNLIDKHTKTPQSTKALLDMMDENGSKIIEQQKIINVLKDLPNNAPNFDKNSTLYYLNNTIDKYKNVLSKDSINTMKGVAKVLTQSGALATKVPNKNLGILGSIPGFQGILSHLEQALENPTMVKMFKGVGEGKPWAKQIGQALRFAPSITMNKLTEQGQ